jgi:hypothetical protein
MQTFAAAFIVVAGYTPLVSAQLGTTPGDADLTVYGRVTAVFQKRNAESGQLVQILVQRSEVPQLDEASGNVRFPAPGEYVYAHVEAGGRVLGSSNVPQPQAEIRA